MIEFQDKSKVIAHFGEDFLEKLYLNLSDIVLEWELSSLKFIESYSANFTISAYSKEYGQVILKFARFIPEFYSELNALEYFNNAGFVKQLKADKERAVMMLDGISPGTLLKEEEDLSTRLSVFTSLVKTIHPAFDSLDERLATLNYNYPSYLDWIESITLYMKSRTDWHELYQYMLDANRMFKVLWDTYQPNTLLHGDFHYYNILKSKADYVVIDPKGVIGNPIFDLPRFMLNEFWDAPFNKRDDVMAVVFKKFSASFSICTSVLKELLYIEGTLAKCLDVESGADLANKPKMIKEISTLRSYL